MHPYTFHLSQALAALSAGQHSRYMRRMRLARAVVDNFLKLEK